MAVHAVLSFWVLFSLSLFFYFFATNFVLGMQINRKRKQRRMNKAKKEINTLYMHCYTQIIRLASDDKSHRISTARKVKAGSRLVFSLIEPKWPLPYCTVPVPLLSVEGCRAIGLGHLLQYMREYNAERPKQGSKRFNCIVKTINIADLGIIYLWKK